VHLNLTNPVDPAKPTQFNPKIWVGLGNWVDMDLKIEKPIKSRVPDKIEPNPKNSQTH
jgi:hypothetical protein